MSLTQAHTPFQFQTRLSLQELTGVSAVTLSQLLRFLRKLPGSVIFHHTHQYLEQHQYLTPEPPNDFAYWVTEILGEKSLGEQLVSINTVEFPSIRALRVRLVNTIYLYLRRHPLVHLRFAKPEEAFHFVKAVSIVFSTPHRATNLREFAQCLEAVTIDSLYYHIFEARIRLERKSNDFSIWLQESLGEDQLAREINALDPYAYTLEEVRQRILQLVRLRLAEHKAMETDARYVR